MRIEKYLKDLIAEKYFMEYGANFYEILYKRYFSTLRKNTGVKITPFEYVYRANEKSNKEKLILSVEKLYISEILSIFSHKVFLKNTVRNKFFSHKVKTGANDFRKTAKLLKEFRNTICHFDIREYKHSKQQFTAALIFFEKLLDCRYKFSDSAIQTIEHKLSIKSIGMKWLLELVNEHQDEYWTLLRNENM